MLQLSESETERESSSSLIHVVLVGLISLQASGLRAAVGQRPVSCYVAAGFSIGRWLQWGAGGGK